MSGDEVVAGFELRRGPPEVTGDLILELGISDLGVGSMKGGVVRSVRETPQSFRPQMREEKSVLPCVLKRISGILVVSYTRQVALEGEEP